VKALVLVLAAGPALAQETAADRIETARCIGNFEGQVARVSRAPGYVALDPDEAVHLAAGFKALATQASAGDRPRLEAARAEGFAAGVAPIPETITPADDLAAIDRNRRCMEHFRAQDLVPVLFPR
jgi:hypothetical protein